MNADEHKMKKITTPVTFNSYAPFSVSNFTFKKNRPSRHYSEPSYSNRPKRYPSPSQPSEKRYKSYKKSVYCSNCGGRGHIFKDCKKPIRSYGIIAFRRCPETTKLQVCLIRRKNTISYEAFIRGKYKLDELHVHLERMTTMEKKKIKQSEWNELYNEICYHRSTKHAQREKKKAKDLYDSVNVSVLFDDISSPYDIPEWEFPKGRKYYYETQTECALREFREETNIGERYVRLLEDTWFETFEGTNKRTYQNQYYLGLITKEANDPYIDLNSKNQITEIGDVDWFYKEDALNLLRDYHDEKKRILDKAFDAISIYL